MLVSLVNLLMAVFSRLDIVMGVQGEEFWTEAAALQRSNADCKLSGDLSSHPHHLLSVIKEIQCIYCVADFY